MGSFSLVVVVPVFEDGDLAARFCRDVLRALGSEAMVVLVDDGSVRNPLRPSAIAEAVEGA